ncbi:unnamed protein product [Discula destructiva]
MATIVRQPFAPLDGTRLQSLNGVKNVQNSIPTVSSPGKRKVTDFFHANDFENVDPTLLLSKRAKVNSNGSGTNFFKKPATFLLTKSTSVPTLSSKDGLSSSNLGKAASSHSRATLHPKSPLKKIAGLCKTSSSPMSAPAGRSPTRGSKRVGILNRRRAVRVDPPPFNLLSGGFSLDAAVKGTVPSYAARSSKAPPVAAGSFYDTALKTSWFFDIHEDTPEQEMTNLLQHSTCMLDISSDEECEKKLHKEKAEGRGKENIPPVDDISQTSVLRTATVIGEGGMEYENRRIALGDLNAEDFYAKGVDPSDVFIVPGDDEDGFVIDGEPSPKEHNGLPETDLTPEVKIEVELAAEDTEAPKTPVKASFQALEGACESFDLWESSSAKEEGDNAPSPVPRSPASEHGDEY